MADAKPVEEVWLPVIGKTLAFLCLAQAEEKMPSRVDSVLKKVKFLEGLGVPRADAATAVGSSSESVRVMLAKGGRSGKTKKRK